MKSFITLIIIGLLLFGCDPPDNSSARALWSGWFRVSLYGGGTEKSYDITMEGQDDLFFDEAENAFFILTEEFSCQYNETSYIEATEFSPEINQQRTGSGTYSKEYYDTEHPIRIDFGVNSLSLNLSEREDNWVTFTNTFNGESMAEEGGCMIDQLYDIGFDEEEYMFPWVDDQGRDAITGQKTIAYGSATMNISFKYHRVQAE